MPIAATAHEPRQTRQRPFAPLGWFVVLSLLLHAVFLWHWRQAPVTIAAPQSTGLAVYLLERQRQNPLQEQQPAAQAMSPESRIKQLARAKPPAVPASNGSTRPQEQSAMPGQQAAPASGAMSTAEEQQNEPPVIDQAALMSSLKVTLQREIARHFSYPLLARRHGWQGEVLLAFRLEADGRISEARVLRSSGYGILDRAALTALGKVGRIGSGIRRGLAMELPVIYRLEG